MNEQLTEKYKINPKDILSEYGFTPDDFIRVAIGNIPSGSSEERKEDLMDCAVQVAKHVVRSFLYEKLPNIITQRVALAKQEAVKEFVEHIRESEYETKFVNSQEEPLFTTEDIEDISKTYLGGGKAE